MKYDFVRNLSKALTFIITMAASALALGAGSHDHMHGSGSGDSGGAHWMAPAAEAAIPNPVEASADSIEKGEQIYEQNCVSCHGENADGKGPAAMSLNPKPSNLRVMAGTHPDGDFAYKIREGRGPMPPWKSALNDKQVWHLVNFIQSLEKQPAKTSTEDSGHGHQHNH